MLAAILACPGIRRPAGLSGGKSSG